MTAPTIPLAASRYHIVVNTPPEPLSFQCRGDDVVDRDFGLPYPVLLVTFPDQSSFSAEFSELAPR